MRYPTGPKTQELIDRGFTHHPPKVDQPARYESIRSAARKLACLGAESCPESAELTIALRKLEESVMYFNAAIARNESLESFNQIAREEFNPANFESSRV